MKSVIFKVDLKGRGIVNYDEVHNQKGLNLKDWPYPVDSHGKKTDNVKVAKKELIETDEVNEKGEKVYAYNVRISANCLRNAIFKNEVDVMNSSIRENDYVCSKYMLSPTGLLRCTVLTNTDGIGIRSASPLTIVDAIQSDNAKSFFEVNTTSGDRSDTSLFYTENVGDITYSTCGSINVKKLMFVCADPIFDRMHIKDDWINNGLAAKVLKSFYGDLANPKAGYFTANEKTLTGNLAEYGLLLNDELVDYLIKKQLEMILSMDISRAKAFAKTSSLKIKIVNDPLVDTFDNEDGWIEIKSVDDINKLTFTPDKFYHESTFEEIEEIKRIKEAYDNKAKERKDKKEDKKKAKSKKKEEAEAEEGETEE